MKHLLTILCSVILYSSLSHAAVTIDISEVEGDVVASASGTINITSFATPGEALNNPSFVRGQAASALYDGWIIVGAGLLDIYTISSTVVFSTGNNFLASSNTGLPVGVWSANGADDVVYVPRDYVSNDPLSATATWFGQTIASMGLVPGTHVFTWGSGADADSLTINIDGSVTPTTYTVGGTVSGLTGSVTLQNNGLDDIIKTTNDGFNFTAQAEGSDYAVTVSSQPTGQTCTVANGSGTISAANVTNVAVTCVTNVIPTYSVGGTLTGLTGTGLALQNNGADTMAFAADGPFTFATELADGAAYAVTVSTQPAGQTCSVSNGSGTIATADVTNADVSCIDDVVPPVVPPAPAVPIPTLSELALILFSMLLGLMVFVNRRRLF